ncbi:hypothetical protein DM01DRAFT_254743 [Hesseltinella vesiculosa]|uniref:Uncharacterized protein n=1 Tax=Hesseltinella vesiculosa TaxID=101127 RepID=A0A1X2GGW0_9FUNG|nr:hypothetical protein DM01DRAFT_254743 [Hesseltinella vesiculosa]
MTKQLSLQGLKDGRLKYLADGVIKVNGDELLLTEVSSGYDNADSSKVSFDHYKAMFGMLAMLKSLSECYHGASFETFSKVKVHFVHGHGTALRHWTLSTPAKGIFVMVKEQKAVVPINDHMKELHLDPFCTFHKTLAMALIDTLSNLKALKNDHKLFLRSPSLTARPNLSTLITPMIIRLNEAKHSAIVADDGPSSAPGSPDNEE